MASTRLNVDVLAIVCEFLTRVPDVLSFSLTCFALRPVAIRWLLSMHPVELTSGPSIHRFHYFLFADLPARAPHIRALEIGSQRFHWPDDSEDPEEYSLLAEILASCLHLEHLLLSPKDTSHHPYDPRPIARAAIEAKTTNVHTLLPMVRAPLRTLKIYTANPRSRRYWTPSALEEILPRFAPTLEKLGLCNLFIDMADARGLDGSSPPRSTLPLTSYAAVRSLSVYSFRGAPLLNVLQHLFPALDGTLHLDEWDTSRMNPYVVSPTHVRATNQGTQQRRGNGPWKKLDRLICPPALFHMLSLRCPVGLLMIDDCSEDLTDNLAMALNENPVTRLKLSLMLTPGLQVFDALMSPGLGGTLTHLALCLIDSVVHGGGVHTADGTTPTGLRWDDILDRTRSSLTPFQKLAHLRVVVHCDSWNGRASVPPMECLDFIHALRNCEAVDLEGFAASFVRVVPSLRFVSIAMSAWFGNAVDVSERWQIARAWRIAEPASNSYTRPTSHMQDQKPILVDLTEEVAAELIRTEELILSEADKLMLRMPED